MTVTLRRRQSAATEHRQRRRSPRVVVSYAPGEGFNPESHECVTRMQLAEQLAALKGCEFAGEYEERDYAGTPYYVPSGTLGCETAARLGIRSEHDLFGGVVPHPFVATKSITHPLPDERAFAPRGWVPQFAAAVEDAVLPGYAAFSVADARRAGSSLLARGAVRVKPALAVGGRAQSVVRTARELHAALAALDGGDLAACGVVLEPQLDAITTYSAGQVRVGALVASYIGTQALTRDNSGAMVYGGSDLTVVRGGFDALLTLDLDPRAHRAVTAARRYDEAAHACFPGFFASRRNYDIASGRDASGTERLGVLEQSWRIGGASAAEIAALEAFSADPGLRAVHACCSEVYGEDFAPPPGAFVYFRGVDEKVGFITKYTVAEPHGDAR